MVNCCEAEAEGCIVSGGSSGWLVAARRRDAGDTDCGGMGVGRR